MPDPVSGRVFISYRRQETSGLAGRLYERLAARLSDDQVFMDVDTIAPGLDFAEVITEAVSTCEVLLAVIGPRWLDATDEDGQRRLEDPDDIVRLEIAAALERNIRVIPILVEGAQMPRRQQLPEDLTQLARRNALSLRHESFRADADRLLAAIEPILAPPKSQEMLAQVEFSRIAVATQSADWYDYEPPPKRTTYPFDRRTSQYVRLSGWVEGTDLPFDVTLINRSASVVLLTHIGIELVAVTHLFDSPYKGEPPQAVKIKIQDAYEVEPHRGLWSPGNIDPDEDMWLDIGDVSWASLDDPVYLPADAAYRFVLNILRCDEGFLSDHAILRLAIRSGEAVLYSPDITAFMHSWTEPLISN